MLKSKTLKFINKKGCYVTAFPSFLKHNVVAAFTTRLGGVSKGRYASLNMSFTNGDDKANVLKNVKKVANIFNLNYKKFTFSHQTHTANLKIITKEDVGKGIVKQRDYNDIDGLITNLKGVTLVTQFADCVPLLFYDTKNKVIAASHAGWKGSVQEIGKLTVKKMQECFNCNPCDIIVGIAPSICVDCYEVDDTVINEVEKIDYLLLDKIYFKKENGKYQLNLWELNRQILINAGIKKENITVTDLCTNCNAHIFHSHRATKGERGNNAAIICMK